MPTPVTPTPPRAGDAANLSFIRMPHLVQRTGLGRSTIYRLMAERKFPTPVKLAGRAVGWRVADVDRWSQTRPDASH